MFNDFVKKKLKKLVQNNWSLQVLGLNSIKYSLHN